MIGRHSSRFVARSYTRPLRLALLLRSPVTSQAFKQAVRTLGTTWGGTRSLIISGTETSPIDGAWTSAVTSFDPDAVLVSRSLRGAGFRRTLGHRLEDLRVAPFWVVDLAEPIRFEERWKPQSVAGLGDDSSNAHVPPDHLTADSLRAPSPIEIAVLGMRPPGLDGQQAVRLSRGERRALSYPLAVRPGSPIAKAAQDVPGFRTQVFIGTPFLYHERDDKDAAMWLWNLRAMRGGLLHGGERELLDFLRFLAVSPSQHRFPRRVLCLDPWPPAAASFVAANPELQVRPQEPSRFRWLPLLRSSTIGFDEELDELSAVDGSLQLPRRAARTQGVGGHDELVQGDGAYAIELDLEPAGNSGLRVSLPPTKALRNSLLSSAYPGYSPRFSRLGVQSRVRAKGDSTLAILPVRWPRSIALSVPSMATVLAAAAGTGYDFELSDKGHYGRWWSRKSVGWRRFAIS